VKRMTTTCPKGIALAFAGGGEKAPRRIHR
jgi:hypothetical protein